MLNIRVFCLDYFYLDVVAFTFAADLKTNGGEIRSVNTEIQNLYAKQLQN